jgi:hypothetical protein
MGSNPTIFRHLLVASLLAGLSAAGLPPCMISAADCAAAATKHSKKTCCCHGKCGAHCRMACCQAPPPAQGRAPAPTKPSDDASVTWGLAAATASAFDAITAVNFRHSISRQGEWMAASESLLALSVRINV